jgi:hypothetical protein
MDRSEYERRIQTLDQRLEASLELVRSAHRVERRALDFLWMTSPGNVGVEGSPFVPLPALPGPTPLPPPVGGRGRLGRRQRVPRNPARWRSLDLGDRVLELLPEMPEVFDRDDFLRRMADNPPERSMLYRVLQQLAWDGQIEVAQPGAGRHPVRYRRASPEEGEGAEV